jgi:hypothetical protein
VAGEVLEVLGLLGQLGDAVLVVLQQGLAALLGQVLEGEGDGRGRAGMKNKSAHLATQIVDEWTGMNNNGSSNNSNNSTNVPK